MKISVLNWNTSVKSMMNKEKWNRDLFVTEETTPVLRMRSLRARRHRERMVDFEDIPNQDGGRVERNFEGGRPSGLGAKNNRSQGMNLPSLLAAHLRWSENGQSLQSSLTSMHGGPRSSINTGGNLPPNGKHLSHNAQPFIPSNLQPPNELIPTHVNLCSQPHMGVTLGQSLNYPPHA
ncbi:hypothetical protein Tco_0770379 [Tanacetum coccineum]|uniref:Uncharacterized protein n=1 Tax=Tanacetum coccineum TaxID=301880 RepID=A0ABQ4ZFX7_9ASTR